MSAWDGLVNTPLLTQLPHYAVNKKLPEDSFYTRRHTAEYCARVFGEVCDRHGVDLSACIHVEPAAGAGCFYDLLPPRRRIGLDINPPAAPGNAAPAPRPPRIQKADFLCWYPPAGKKYVVLGNPPFGVRGALALAFINRSFLFAEAVGFILPMSFYSNGKGSNMKRVKNAALLHSEKLGAQAFDLRGGGETAAVNTVFQVWRRRTAAAAGAPQKVFDDYDVSDYMDIYTCCSAPSRYCGLGRGRVYDCFIASTFYRQLTGVVRTFDEVLYGSGYGMILKKNKREILRLLQKTDWTRYCSDATNHCRHIRMYHIRKLLGDNGFGRKKQPPQLNG